MTAKNWENPTVEDEMNETKMIVGYIVKKVEELGREKAVSKIIKGLKIDKVKSESEKQEIKERIEFYLNSLQDIHLCSTYQYGNDIARALALRLNIFKGLNVSKHNVMSYHSDIRQYDPKKNGLNILKHGLSFDEVLSMSNGVFGRLLITVFEDGDERCIVFTKASGKEKYIVSVVKFHSAEEESSNLEEEIGKIAKDVADEKINTEGASIEYTMTQKDLFEIMNRARDWLDKIYNTKPMTFISSWYFDISNFDKTVTERIRFTGNPDVKDPELAAKQMKERALIILKNAWGIEIK